MIEVLEDDAGRLEIHEQADGKYFLRGIANENGMHMPTASIVVDYPLSLIRKIFAGYGSLYTCDEVGRDMQQTEAAIDVYYSVAAYFPDEYFSRPLRILDYGCGGGSSTMTLARLFPEAQIIGMDFVPKFLDVARARAEHRGLSRVQFFEVNSSGTDPLVPQSFDAVFLNAVYEHLMPGERPQVLGNLWHSLKPGGSFFLNQTPHRWFPIETHTSGLPMVNYLPGRLAMWAIQQFSPRVVKSYSWEELLRAGVRGATVTEIMGHIKHIDANAEQLKTIRIAKAWPGIWYAAKRHRIDRVPRLETAIRFVEGLVNRTGLPLAPYISLAARKNAA